MNDLVATPGARLKAERERRGLSAQKAADQLHLDAWVIDALEAGDYARIGPSVYAKGHLKRYAALLGLPAAELAAEFDAISNPAAAAAARAPLGSALDTPVNHVVTPTQMWGAAALLVLLAVVVWWKPWQHREASATNVAATPAAGSPASAESQQSASQPDEVAANLTQPPLPSSGHESARAIPIVARTSPEQAANSAAPPPPADASLPGAGRARLRLSFTADSWVDVRDAQGNKTYVGNGSANTVKSISGQAPMHVYLRSGSGVQLEINGRAVAIGPQFFAGDVARFEAGADGVLRREAHRDAVRGESSASTRPPG